MRRYLLAITLLICIWPSSSWAQTDTERYSPTPDYMQQLLSDIIATDCKTLQFSDGGGHYIGYSRHNSFFGWGSYRTDNGNRWIGQWNKGKCIFGILIKGTIGRVGSDTHYVEYDLTSGAINHIVKDGERINYSTSQAEASPYRFVRINYEGGDYYIGETYNGRRHGLGIYHWSNGNHWYGTFNNDYRQGYGALFCTDGTIDHGLWLGNDKQ